MTRRQRLLWLTSGLAALFVLASAGLAWRQHTREPTYRPGEQVEGLTADLARSLPRDHPDIEFADVTRAAHIDFHHFNGTRTSQLPEDMGSGAAWGDYDGDGWEDLVVANEVGPLDMPAAERERRPPSVTLYHNNHDGTFTDMTAKAGLTFRGLGMGVYWADYDNDGHPDLLITAYGHNVLYHNNGDGTFTDVSAKSGIGLPEGFWTGAAWGDYDRDGFLDLYVTGYVKYTKDVGNAKGRYDLENPASINPLTFPPERNLLFHNNGNGTFTEVAAKAGVLDTTGRGLAAAWVDFDEDGWPDLYVANDVSPNALFRNLGNGRFENVGEKARVMDYRSSMGIAVGDWNGDGSQDMYLTHWIAQGNALYDNVRVDHGVRRPGKPESLVFMDEADRYGLGQISLDFTGWATSFIDFDDDGKLDLFVVNGSTLQSRADAKQLVPMKSKIFWDRSADEGFYDLSPIAGEYFQKSFVGRGAAFADYDHDGRVDVFVVNFNGDGILLRNESRTRNHWLEVTVRGTKSNRDGIGAEVRVVAGGKAQIRQIGAQAPYLSQNSLTETFGLGSLTRADTIEVRWPSGLHQTRTGVAADQRLTIVEGEGDSRAVSASAVLSGRDSVQEFWNLMREATSLRIAGRAKEASDGYARALALDPRHEDALYYYGSARFDLGDFAGAERIWRRLVTQNAGSARGHSQLGMLFSCLDRGAPYDPDSALAHLRIADALNREQTGPRLHLGEVELLRGNAGEAGSYFDKVVATDAQNAHALFYLGYLHWSRGDAKGARTFYQRAAKAPSPGAPVGVASNEGDTRTGAPVAPARQSAGRCRALDTLTAGLHADDTPAVISDRYERLGALLRSRRSL